MTLKKKLFLILLLLISAIPLTGDSALRLYSILTTQSKDIPVYVTKTGKKYHRGDCRYLRQSKIKISRKDAIAYGYTPCKICKR